MQKIIPVYVSAQDIRDGLRRSCRHCPVALALRRRGLTSACVSSDHCVFDGGSGVRLPPRVTRFINDFDAGLPIRPFTFRLIVNLPDQQEVTRAD